jgi:hypothetical protein
VLAESTVATHGTVARVIQHFIVRRQLHGVILVSTHDGADATVPVFERFDVPVGEIVQTPLIGLRIRQTADHRIVD